MRAQRHEIDERMTILKRQHEAQHKNEMRAIIKDINNIFLR